MKAKRLFVAQDAAEGWAGSADFWATVKAVRTYRGVTQAEMAKQLGLSGSYLSYLEDGKRKTTVSIVESVMISLGMTLSELEEAKKWLMEVPG